MKSKLLLICLLTSFFLTAQSIFKDDLATYTINTPLHGQGLWTHDSPTTGGYGGGPCFPISSGQPCFSSNVVSNSISYLNYGTSGLSIEVAGKLDNPGHPILPIIADGDLYVSFVMKLTTAPPSTGAVDFFRSINNADLSTVAFRLVVKDAGTGYNIGIKKGGSGNTTVFTTGSYNYNENVLVVIKYSTLTDIADDVVNLYVNPDYAAGEPITPTATTDIGTDNSGAIDRIFFRFGFNPDNTLPTGFAGLVSAARTWFDLGFIPLSVDQFDATSFTIIGSQASKGLLSINSKMAISNATLNIYTITGQLIENKTISLEATNNDIAISPVHQAAVYIVELITENGTKYTKKITIN